MTSTGIVTGAFLTAAQSGPYLGVHLDYTETYCDGAGCTVWTGPRDVYLAVQIVRDTSGNIVALDFAQNTTTYGSGSGTTFTTRATGYVTVS